MTQHSEAVLSFIDRNVLGDYERLTEVSQQYNDDAATINGLMNQFEEAADHLNETVSSIAIAVNEVAATVNEGGHRGAGYRREDGGYCGEDLP
ncbi:hypothetical protein ACFTAO_13625 [Paenibacillus rhizoplanae]